MRAHLLKNIINIILILIYVLYIIMYLYLYLYNILCNYVYCYLCFKTIACLILRTLVITYFAVLRYTHSRE